MMKFDSYRFQVVQETRQGEVRVMLTDATFAHANTTMRRLVESEPKGSLSLYRVEPIA